MLTASLFFCVALSAPPPRIVIDGRFDDWDTVATLVDDPADAPQAAVDFGQVRVSHDDRFVHLLIEVGRPVNVQRLPGTIRVLLDSDGSVATGEPIEGLGGVDVIVELSPRNPDRGSRIGRGVGLFSTSAAEPLSPHDAGLTFAPTYAGDRFELRIERGVDLPQTPPFLKGRRLSGLLLFLDSEGTVRDRTDPFTYALTVVAPDRSLQLDDPLAAPRGTALRVVSWNAEFGAVLTKPELSGRILRALGPGVILFQELRKEDTPGMLAEFLDRHLPLRGRAKWSVVVGAGGGNLRCAVAAQTRLEPSEPLRLLPYPDVPQRSVRVAAGVVTIKRRRLLVVSVHLMCCGRAGSFEDRTRQIEADAIRRAVSLASAAAGIDGVIIAGDLNLVGSRRPLDLVAEGLDTDGSALMIAEAYQIDGRSNATWSNAKQPFVPGRLDFLLYADTALQLLNTFILDTRDLSDRWLTHHMLQAGDTAAASDHFPLVADFR